MPKSPLVKSADLSAVSVPAFWPMTMFEEGVDLYAKNLKFVGEEIRIYDNCSLLEVTIHEGRNRQIRRMFELLGYEVQELDRVEFAGLRIQNLKRGEWRFLTENEINFLKKLKQNTIDSV